MNKVPSNEYLGDSIDYFKKAYIDGFGDKEDTKTLIKIVSLEGNHKKYIENLNHFFKGIRVEPAFKYDITGNLNLKMIKAKHIFIDPPIGLSGLGESSIGWGKKNKSQRNHPEHLDLEVLKTYVDSLNDKDVQTISFYQHRPRNKIKNALTFLNSYIRKDLRTKKIFACQVMFKDFFVISLSLSSKHIMDNSTIQMQRQVRFKGQVHFFDFKNGKWTKTLRTNSPSSAPT